MQFDSSTQKEEAIHSIMQPKRRVIIAEEECSDHGDIIPGPIDSLEGRVIRSNNSDMSNTRDTNCSDSGTLKKGNVMMASAKDLKMPAEEFAEGCKLLQQAALGNQQEMEKILKARPRFVNFRDYDRRTAIHVAASEGHLDICKYLIKKGAKVNRSDRWGGSPLDDAHRHQHQEVITFLRNNGAITGSTQSLANFINAAAEGDAEEVKFMLSVGDVKVDDGDYDKRTALHLAAGDGHENVVKVLCEAGANVNIEDRWCGRPLDDARRSNNLTCIEILEKFGAKPGKLKEGLLDQSSKRQQANLEVAFADLEMVDRIGKGAFGEIYKCRWKGTLVAAKCIKSARIRKEWLRAQTLLRIERGQDIDEALHECDEADMDDDEKDMAMADFRREISLLKSLRHPNIVLLLAYSVTENMEVMISELMRCSLLDILNAHIINRTKMKKNDQIVYATHLARGMLYLHTCKSPIIHRDLKPANLLIDNSGVLKVADFGLSKVRPDPRKAEGDTFNMTGETGSYRFMAPEVFRHEPYTEAVDIYSYSMILFFLLDGKAPWSHLNGLVAAKKAAEFGDRPVIPRHWDQRLQGLLQECWNENPQVRLPFDKILLLLDDYSRKYSAAGGID